MCRLAAPVSESRSARFWTCRNRTALRRFSAATAENWPSTEATRRSTPKMLRDRCSTTMAPTGRPSATMGDTSRLRASGRVAHEQRVELGVEALDREQAAPFPGRPDDRVGGCRAVPLLAPREARTIRFAFRRAENQAARDAEPRSQAIEHDPRLVHRIGHLVQAGADVHQRLQVGPPLAQLTLVHGREDRGRQREQPERGHVQHRHAVELDPAPGDDVHRGEKLGGLGVENDEQQQRMPQRDLQPGAVRGEQRHSHQVQVDQEANRALGRTGHVHGVGEVQPVDQQHGAQQRHAEAPKPATAPTRRAQAAAR